MLSLPRPQIRALLTLGLPLVGSQVAQSMIHIIDTAMLGRYDLQVLAGVVLATMLWFTLFIVGSGFAFAVTPLVAAAETDQDARRITRMGLWTSMGFAMLSLPVCLEAGPILHALGEPPELAAIAADYLSIAAWGLFPAFGVVVLKAFFAARHQSKVVLWVTLGGVLLNTGLNALLIFGLWGAPELGAKGAALASSLTHLMSFLAMAVYLGRTAPEVRMFHRLWRPDWAHLGQVFRLGWPICVATLAEVALFSAATVMMGWIGTAALAAHGIALQVAVITFNVHLGLSQAATVLAGQAFAAEDAGEIRATARAALWCSGLVAVAALVVMLVVPRPLISLFADPADPLREAILATGVWLVRLAGLFQLADGAQVVMISLLRGIQDTHRPMVLTMISYWGIGATAAYGLGIGAGLGGAGVWTGLLLGLCAAAILLSWRFWWHPAVLSKG